MSVADQIRRIKNAKAAIKQSIENKGVTVSDTAKLDDYPMLINSISGSENNDTWPDFFDRKTKKISDCRYLFSDITIYEIETKYKELIENFNTSNVYGFDNVFTLFNNPSSGSVAPSGAIKELDLTKWNVSKGSSFKETFDMCILDYLDISGWDFSNNNGTSAYLQLFFGTKIKEVNMTNCNTSKVKTFYRFAYQASELVTINMTGCDTSAATSMSSLFGDCKKLVSVIGEIDGSGLTSGFYPGASTSPFSNCISLETLYLKNIYKDIAITNASKFSIDLGVTKVKDECLVYIIDQLPNLADKGITNNTAIKLTLPTTNTLTDEQKQVAIDKGWIVVN